MRRFREPRSSVRRAFLGLAGALCLTAGLTLPAAPARADGLIIVPPHEPDRPHIRNIPLAVREHKVTVTVTDRIAVTEVDQVFVNPNPRALEGTYLFPLPPGAAIDKFSMWIDGKEIGAELLDAAKARAIYEGIVRSMRDPALLEYADRGLFKARIFPIEANGEKRVRIRYAEILSAENGTVAYRYPLATERFSSKPLEQASIDVRIAGDSPIASVWSPSHRIDVATPSAAAPNSARATWETRGTLPDRDFLLFWRPTAKPVAITAIAHRDAPSGGTGTDADGTFLLVLAPRPSQSEAPMPKDIVFVMDTSGSMAGKKIEQARSALQFCLRSLGPDDRFGVVPFSTEPRPFRSELVQATPENRAQAEKYVADIMAAGGTAIDDALRAGLQLLPDDPDASGRPAYVLFLTDGLPTIGESRPEEILKRAGTNAHGARIFAFGVGTDVNVKLLDRLAEDLRGARDYVADNESIEEKVSNLYGKLSRPAMTSVELKIDGVATSAVHPGRLPDLFYGSELLVAGRYAAGGSATVRLKGKVRGQDVEIVEELKLPAAAPLHSFLPRLWAVRRVAFLLDEIRLRGETTEVRDEVVKLAKKFGIVTPYTSYLIVEDSVRRGEPSLGGGWPAPGSPAGDSAGPPSSGGGGGDMGGGGVHGRGKGALPPAPDAPETKRLREEAEKGRSAAQGGESGKDAVDDARARRELRDYDGDKAEGQSRKDDLFLHVEGRSFVRRADAWWEQGAETAKEIRKIAAYSPEYFELLGKYPELGKILKLGRVAFLVDGVVVEITD